MIESLVVGVLLFLGGYSGVGVLLAIVIHWRGFSPIDTTAQSSGPFFRILVTPGLVTFWPLLLYRWRQGRQGGDTSGALEGPVSPKGMRYLQGAMTAMLLLICPAIILAATALRENPESFYENHIELVPERELYRTVTSFGQIFPSVPAEVRIGRTFGRRFGLIFNFHDEDSIPPMALYWSESLNVPESQLPAEAIFLGFFWQESKYWCSLRLPETRRGGYWLVYSFLTDSVESVSVADKIITRQG